MHRVVRTLGTHCVVWTTMAASVFATTPHFECICPDGTRKPLCFSVLFGGPARCCDLSAAGGTKPATPKKRCCCQVDPQSSENLVDVHGKFAGRGSGISQRCCEKELTEGVPCVEDQDPPFALTGALLLLFSIPLDVGSDGSILAHAGLDYSPRIEPPDLLLQLQRLVI